MGRVVRGAGWGPSTHIKDGIKTPSSKFGKVILSSGGFKSASERLVFTRLLN